MAAKLTGIVMGMREVEGVTKDGPRKGESWSFLSLEINDVRYGHIWSCQVRHDDIQYPDLVGQDLVGHKVQMTIKSQSAGERQLQDGRKVMQIRSQVTNVRDLGVPNDDEE
ncbi:MAG TPA: hypothetical protein VJ761_15055 [Ktedonobacteraceae bacterium]|nr:hypothetical protein [Ktedonobacteraceae bacterium]